MSDILSYVGTIMVFAAKKVLGPVIIVCGCYTMILYVITRLFESQLRESNGKLRKVLRAISKPPLKVFTFLGGLPEFKIIGYGAAGVGVIALIGVIATNFSFNMLLPSLVLVAICAGGTAFGLFCILLACKGFAAALGYTMAVLGDEDTYIDTVRSIDGKFIVYDDEEESMYPEDLVTHSNVTRAEAEAQHRRDTDEIMKSGGLPAEVASEIPTNEIVSIKNSKRRNGAIWMPKVDTTAQVINTETQCHAARRRTQCASKQIWT